MGEAGEVDGVFLAVLVGADIFFAAFFDLADELHDAFL